MAFVGWLTTLVLACGFSCSAYAVLALSGFGPLHARERAICGLFVCAALALWALVFMAAPFEIVWSRP